MRITDKYLGQIDLDAPRRRGFVVTGAQSPAAHRDAEVRSAAYAKKDAAIAAQRHGEVRSTALTKQEYVMPHSPTMTDGLTQEEFDAQMASLRRHAGVSPSAPSWSKADHFTAIATAKLIHSGRVKQVGPIHPLAYQYLERDEQFTDVDAIRAAAIAVFGPEVVARNNLDNPVSCARFLVYAAGDLSELFTVSTELALTRSTSPILEKVLALSYPVQARDFRSIEVADIQLQDFGPPLTGQEFTPYQRANLTGTTFNVEIGTVDVKLACSHQQIVNNQAIDILAQGAAAFRNQAYRKELQVIAEALDANADLGDGAVWFAAGTSNLVTGADIDAAGLADATAALRDQATLAGSCDLDAAVMLVGADDEIAARALCYSLEGTPIRVIGTGFLSGSSWYLIARPTEAPSIARVTFQGAQDSVTFSPAQRSDDGLGLSIEASHRVSFGVASRIGIVRAEKP